MFKIFCKHVYFVFKMRQNFDANGATALKKKIRSPSRNVRRHVHVERESTVAPVAWLPLAIRTRFPSDGAPSLVIFQHILGSTSRKFVNGQAPPFALQRLHSAQNTENISK